MEFMKVMQAITSGKGGQFRSITWHKQLKVYKGMSDIVEKRTTAVLRMGVNYDHKSAVIEKRESGELPSENQGLADAYRWLAYPYILENVKSGSIQLRLTTADNSKFDTHYYLNGEEVNKADLNGIALASEFSKGDMPDVFNVRIENILEIR